MDSDSSTKFIASLTKFLQSLCNGYVEFQNGVELAGHIYLSIDTGEKVDYILHEKVCKNDENSVTFISNSFHALPADKRKDGKQPEQSKDAQSKTSAKSDARSKDDDDVVILDHDSSSSGTSSRGMKRAASPGLDQRHRTSGQRNASGSLQGSGTRQGSRGIRQQPSATVTSQDEQRGENFDAGDVKLEQMTTDELLSLASQVSDTPGGPPQRTSAASHRRTTPPRPRNSREAPQEMWIKQEVTDDADVPGGSDSGQSWPHGRDDSNSGPGGGLYPVMLHQNTAAFSPTGFPVFPTTSQHHGLGQPLPSTSSASHPYANPIPGTSQGAGAVDPAESQGLLSYKGKHDPWLINEAAMRVRMKQMTLRKAAEIYKIPRSTISDRVTGRVRLTAICAPKPNKKRKEFGQASYSVEGSVYEDHQNKIKNESSICEGDMLNKIKKESNVGEKDLGRDQGKSLC